MGAAPAAGVGLSALAGHPDLARLIEAIVAGDRGTFDELLSAHPELASARVKTGATRAQAKNYFFGEIAHYAYAGDTALRMAAAAHSADLVGSLVSAGSDVAAVNRRGAQPLHYAVDGGPNGPCWDPAAQSDTVGRLIDAGADPSATDKGGTTPLHRAIRNRCASAVEVLLARVRTHCSPTVVDRRRGSWRTGPRARAGAGPPRRRSSRPRSCVASRPTAP